MKKLILLRHGTSDYADGPVNVRGMEQMEGIIEEIQRIIDDLSVAILSSSAQRASDSARIIAEHFDVPFEEHDVLWSDQNHPMQLDAALVLVQKAGEKADVLIVVTHMEYMEWFHHYFGNNVLGRNDFPVGILRNGCAWVIDCDTGTCDSISYF